jgi:hypothetical protein
VAHSEQQVNGALSESGIKVESGVGYSMSRADPSALPIVRITATDKAGNVATLHLTPAYARRVGLDLVGAASAAVTETAIRAWAKDRGEDADTIILWLRTGTQVLLDSEGEPT